MYPIDQIELLEKPLGRMHLTGDADGVRAPGDVFLGNDQQHARGPACGACIDAGDRRMGVGASDEDRLQRARGLDVGNERRLSLEQAIVFDPLD